jgi:AmmeMemoRadiSam system protein A
MNEEVSNQLGLCEEEHILLRRVAHDSIVHGLDKGTPLPVDVERYPPVLRRPGASFVTLQEFGELRGCIGSLEAHQPLVEDIAQNAHAAAFRDPRFQPLQRQELKDLEIHISVLTPAEPMDFNSEQDLLRQLRPGTDGLILEDRGLRGTFLPSVWESLPDPRDFLAHLKLKAGLPVDYWSDTLKVSRYTCEVF